MQAVSRADAKETILDAVVTVVVRDGLEGASLRAVATEADVSLGLLGYHFAGKQALIAAAFVRATDRWIEAADRVGDGAGDPSADVRAFVAAPFEDRWLQSDQLLLRVTLWTAARTDAALAAVEKSLVANYRTALCARLARLEPAAEPDELRARATDVMSMQDGVRLQWSRTGNRLDLERGLDRCIELAQNPPPNRAS